MKLDKLNEMFEVYNQAAVARKLGISRSSLCKKLKGKPAFTMAEVSKLCDILRLSDEEIRDIFLGKE